MNLEKLKDTARKLEQKEEWRKALEVYLKAIQQIESSREGTPDISLYNRVGDLYMKVNDTAAAVRSYERAVDLYADQGFFNNAIALCGKVLRVNPGRTEIYLKLAQLHARKNVVIEAKRNLLEYIERMNAVGQLDEAFAAVKKFTDQFSANQDIRMMLVELLRASSRTADAKEQLEKLEREMEARGDADGARRTREALEAIDHSTPGDRGRRGDLIFLDTGTGYGPGAGRSAGTAAQAGGGPAAVEPTAAEPAATEPPVVEAAPLPGIEPTVLAAEPPSDADEPLGASTLSFIEPAPATEAAGEPIEPLVLERNEGIDFAAAFEEAAPPGPPPDFETTVLEVEPSLGETAGPADLMPLDLSPDAPAEAAGPDFGTPAVADLDLTGAPMTAGDDLLLADAADAPPPVEPIDLGPGVGDELITLDAGDATQPSAAPIDPDGIDLEFLPTDPGEELRADGDARADLPYIEVERPAGGAEDVGALEERVLENPDDPALHRRLADELIRMGEVGRALGELELALETYEAREAWDDALAVAGELAELEPDSIARYQKWVELAYRTGDRGTLVNAYLALGAALVRAGAPEKAEAVYHRVIEHDPGNAEAERALALLAGPPVESAPAEAPPVAAEPVAAAPSAPADSFVDLGALVLEEEGPRDTRMRVERSDPKQEDEEREFLEILAEFKRGIEQNLATDDYEAHYDLGVAFREMGLLDEAIAEFQKALRAPEGRLRTSEALGMAFYDKGQYAISESILRRAVDTLEGTDDAKIGLIYWLGRAAEAQGKHDEAVASYERALAVDIRFQDVSERIQRLTADRRA